jgi:hypothetical protein
LNFTLTSADHYIDDDVTLLNQEIFNQIELELRTPFCDEALDKIKNGVFDYASNKFLFVKKER